MVAQPIPFRPPDKDYMRQLKQMRLQQIEQEIGKLLIDAAICHGSANPEIHASAATRVVAQTNDDLCTRAQRAALATLEARVVAACAEVHEAWEDHLAADFLEDRLAEVVAKITSGGAGLVISAYHRAFNEPERFCECGAVLMAEVEHQRRLCRQCWIGREVWS